MERKPRFGRNFRAVGVPPAILMSSCRLQVECITFALEVRRAVVESQPRHVVTAKVRMLLYATRAGTRDITGRMVDSLGYHRKGVALRSFPCIARLRFRPAARGTRKMGATE